MNRLTASVSAAVLATGASLIPLAPAAADTAAPTVVQKVRPADLGPGKPWIRLEDDPSNAGRTPGTEEVSAFADPVRFNGSLHLGIGAGQQSQAAHHFTARTPLATVAASELSYDSYVHSASSTATGTAANLQLPMICHGGFTTLSFQPQLATDSQGRAGVVPDTWQNFTSGATSLWRTSRAVPTVPTLPAGADATLSDYIAACTSPGDGVLGVIGNVGRLGDTTATLDTHIDNLTVNGTVYDFAVSGLATGHIALRNSTSSSHCHSQDWHCHSPNWHDSSPGWHSNSPGWHSHSTSGTITFRDPANGPDYRAVGTRLVFSGGRALSPGDLSVTANGRPLTLTDGPGNTLIAVVAPSPSISLGPNGTYSTPITISFANRWYSADPHGRGALNLTAELLARGYKPLQRTGVITRTTLRT